MDSKIISRILRKAQIPNLLEVLTGRLSLSDLQSLLLEVFRLRAGQLTPRDLLAQYQQNRFVRPGSIHPLKIMDFDRLAFSLLPADFEIIELSPVCPFGTTSVLAPVHQNHVLTTIRNTEVCSDATNVMALEAALKRRAFLAQHSKSSESVKLATTHRLVRTQFFDQPGSVAHFLLFGMCTAGRDTGSYEFEMKALNEHLDFYLHLMHQLNQIGLQLNQIQVCVMLIDFIPNQVLENEVINPLKKKYPGMDWTIQPNAEQDKDYYSAIRFQVHAENQAGDSFLLVDGGATDWTQQLLNNNKERLFISGIGTERLFLCFEKKEYKQRRHHQKFIFNK